jgi:serine/threonine protein kinase
MLNKLFGGQPAKSTPGAKASEPINPALVPAAPVKLKKVNLEKRFTILAETGQGSMSRVYKAVDNEAGRTVCLKVQDKEKTADAAARAGAAGRLSEGEIGMRIVHPNVVRTLDFGISPKGEHFLVMEFIDGVGLMSIRTQRPDLDLADRIELLAEMADGLQAIHNAGFIHHDFGPKNVMVDRDDKVKLIDFGLTVPDTPEFHRPGNRTGTLNYMAPELLRRESTNHLLDVFSFGVSAYEFLTGKLPYEAATSMEMMLRRINTPPIDIATAGPDLPADLCDVIRKLMARSPKERYQRMSEVASAFRGLSAITDREAAKEREEAAIEARKATPEYAAEDDDFLGALGIGEPAAQDADPEDLAPGSSSDIRQSPIPSPEPPAAPRPPRPELPKDVRKAVWDRDAGACALCGGTDKLKYKPIVSFENGGPETPDNIRLICQPCRHKSRRA